MIENSLNYLRNGDDWVKTLLIGGVLGLLGVLIVPTFIVYGYLMRVLRATMRGEERVPEFDDWGDMTVDGLKAFVITLVYGIVPAILGTVFIGFGVLTLFTGGSTDSGILAGLGTAGVLFGVLLTLVLSLVAAYFIPAALANYGETGRIGSGFAFGELRPVLTSTKYLTAWAYAIAIAIGASVLVGIVSITGVGAIVAPFVSFYVGVAAAYIFGTTWGELHPVQLRDDAPGQQPAV
ncbi:DUF4013 domain-containing protein [Halobium salinum]|uniref:DUF4013 domain-containing protein n=1 Tax=Halobium salinum TaxID=1364940 RepID=A0ABD5PEF5_9EURY|nr:DUF4013 domain-containing protein [Halobium salinum]